MACNRRTFVTMSLTNAAASLNATGSLFTTRTCTYRRSDILSDLLNCQLMSPLHASSDFLAHKVVNVPLQWTPFGDQMSSARTRSPYIVLDAEESYPVLSKIYKIVNDEDNCIAQSRQRVQGCWLSQSDPSVCSTPSDSWYFQWKCENRQDY